MLMPVQPCTAGKAGKGAVDDKPKTKLMDPIVSMLDMVVRWHPGALTLALAHAYRTAHYLLAPQRPCSFPLHTLTQQSMTC